MGNKNSKNVQTSILLIGEYREKKGLAFDWGYANWALEAATGLALTNPIKFYDFKIYKNGDVIPPKDVVYKIDRYVDI